MSYVYINYSVCVCIALVGSCHLFKLYGRLGAVYRFIVMGGMVRRRRQSRKVFFSLSVRQAGQVMRIYFCLSCWPSSQGKASENEGFRYM